MLSCELLPSGHKRFGWLLTIVHLFESNSHFCFVKTWKLVYYNIHLKISSATKSKLKIISEKISPAIDFYIINGI